MFKNMKLGTKLACGFGLMVVIAGVLGYMGWSSLGRVAARVENADDANRLLKWAKDCRLQEKNFILRGDKKYQQENDQTMEEIFEQVDVTRAKFRDPADIQTIDDVKAKGHAYKEAYDAWVTLWERQQGQATQMLEAAHEFTTNCDALRAEQKQQFGTVMAEADRERKDKRRNMEAAEQMLAWVYNAKAYRVALMQENTPEDLARWKELNKSIIDTAKTLKSRLDLRENIAKVDEAIRDYSQYESLFLRYLENPSDELASQAGAAAKKVVDVLEAIAGDQKQQLEEVAVRSAEQIADKLWKADTANRLIKLAKDCRIEEKNYMLRRDAKYQQQNDETMKKIYETCDELSARFNNQQNKQEVAAIRAAAERYKAAYDAWVDLAVQQKVEEDQMVAAARSFGDGAQQLRVGQKEKMESAKASAVNLMITLSIGGILVGCLLAWVITRGITKPINRIIDALSEGAEQVTEASGQVSTTSQQLAEGASEQASSLEETSSALEEMAAMTRTNAENAKEANTLSNQARDAAQNGDQTMKRLNDAMDAINESSGEISKIIKVIEEIAFQTNLLALNAAVEAARAGEHGKGFAVVAEEVRNLAQRAAEAARETTGLIEQSVTRAKEGGDVAHDVAEALGAIVGDVAKVSELINGIAKASEEQAQGVEQVNTAVSQMDKVTQSNAAGAEESASASEELSAQAAAVNGVVGELAALVGGATNSGRRGSVVRGRGHSPNATSGQDVSHVGAHGSTPHESATESHDGDMTGF